MSYNFPSSRKVRDGYKKRFTDHRDYDFHKTFGTANFDVSQLPENFSVDAGLTMPDQMADGYPMGCAGYEGADLCANQDNVAYDGGELYRATPPFDEGGRDLRAMLSILKTRGPKTPDGKLGEKRTAYFNIRRTDTLDWFDAIRVAIWVNREEKRAAGTGVPWFPEFEDKIGPDGILQAPTQYAWKKANGHAAVDSGWETVNGAPYLLVKSWQGRGYGKKGWCLMSREICNSLLNMYFTEAFTVTKRPDKVETVAHDLDLIELLVSYLPGLIQKWLVALAVQLGK